MVTYPDNIDKYEECKHLREDWCTAYCRFIETPMDVLAFCKNCITNKS